MASDQFSDASGQRKKTPLPKRLKLEFSRAADIHRISGLLQSTTKQKYDPNNYVVERTKGTMKKALSDGSCCFLSHQDNGYIYAFAAYFHLHANKNHAGTSAIHDYAELGSTVSFLPGYGAGPVIAAAQTLKEWWEHPPKESLVAEAKKSNGASLHGFQVLAWKAINDRTLHDKLTIISNDTVAHDCDKVTPDPNQEPDSVWLVPTKQTYMVNAKILLQAMQQGGVINKKTGKTIPVDFSALDQIGLTKSRLQAIAGGTVSKTILRRIDNSPSSGPQPS